MTSTSNGPTTVYDSTLPTGSGPGSVALPANVVGTPVVTTSTLHLAVRSTRCPTSLCTITRRTCVQGSGLCGLQDRCRSQTAPSRCLQNNVSTFGNDTANWQHDHVYDGLGRQWRFNTPTPMKPTQRVTSRRSRPEPKTGRFQGSPGPRAFHQRR